MLDRVVEEWLAQVYIQGVHELAGSCAGPAPFQPAASTARCCIEYSAGVLVEILPCPLRALAGVMFLGPASI